MTENIQSHQIMNVISRVLFFIVKNAERIDTKYQGGSKKEMLTVKEIFLGLNESS